MVKPKYTWLEFIKDSRIDHQILCCLSFKRIKFNNKSTEHPLLWLISLTTAAIRNDIFPNIKNLATFPTIKIKHNVQHRRHECGKTSPINNKSYDHYPIARYPSDIPKRGASPWTSHQPLCYPSQLKWSAYKTNTYPVCMGGKTAAIFLGVLFWGLSDYWLVQEYCITYVNPLFITASTALIHTHSHHVASSTSGLLLALTGTGTNPSWANYYFSLFSTWVFRLFTLSVFTLTDRQTGRQTDTSALLCRALKHTLAPTRKGFYRLHSQPPCALTRYHYRLFPPFWHILTTHHWLSAPGDGEQQNRTWQLVLAY